MQRDFGYESIHCINKLHYFKSSVWNSNVSFKGQFYVIHDLYGEVCKIYHYSFR